MSECIILKKNIRNKNEKNKRRGEEIHTFYVDDDDDEEKREQNSRFERKYVEEWRTHNSEKFFFITFNSFTQSSELRISSYIFFSSFWIFWLFDSRFRKKKLSWALWRAIITHTKAKAAGWLGWYLKFTVKKLAHTSTYSIYTQYTQNKREGKCVKWRKKK
jgi:hypothetical protein